MKNRIFSTGKSLGVGPGTNSCRPGDSYRHERRSGSTRAFDVHYHRHCCRRHRRHSGDHRARTLAFIATAGRQHIGGLCSSAQPAGALPRLLAADPHPGVGRAVVGDHNASTIAVMEGQLACSGHPGWRFPGECGLTRYLDISLPFPASRPPPVLSLLVLMTAVLLLALLLARFTVPGPAALKTAIILLIVALAAVKSHLRCPGDQHCAAFPERTVHGGGRCAGLSLAGFLLHRLSSAAHVI